MSSVFAEVGSGKEFQLCGMGQAIDKKNERRSVAEVVNSIDHIVSQKGGQLNHFPLFISRKVP